jgi:hypothetical protein
MARRSAVEDDEEVQSLVAETSRQEGRRTTEAASASASASSSGNNSSATVWKFLTLILFGIVLLFATDSIEIKLTNKQPTPNTHINTNSGGGGEEGSTTTTTENNDYHETLPSASTVELKDPLQLQDAASTAIKEDTLLPENTDDSSKNDNNTPALTTTSNEDDAGNEPAASPETISNESSNTDTTTSTIGGDGNTEDDETTTSKRHSYAKRGQPMSEEDRQAMRDQWGSWTLNDDKERPTNDYYKNYPNRDIPRSAFPSNAWQIDTDYLSKFLPESIALAQRAQDAILAEYGKTNGTWEERAEMFRLDFFETLEDAAVNKNKRGGQPTWYDRGGWTTPKSWEGLQRRLLHAVMTGDSFVFAMGGHSAAAGHG